MTIDYQESGDDPECMNATELPLFSWHSSLADKGFFMLPMVWRAGACVTYNGKVGCLVPGDGTDEACDGNFLLGTLSYCAIVAANERVKIPVMHALRDLLPIGHRLYLKCSVHPEIRVSNSVEKETLLQVHLDTPNGQVELGKVSVAYVIRKSPPFNATAVVDPWDLLVEFDAEAYDVCKFAVA